MKRTNCPKGVYICDNCPFLNDDCDGNYED